MMSRSHVLIGLAATAAGACAGWVAMSPATLIAAVVGSLAPDIDTPYSTLGRLAPLLSRPLHRWFGHRTVTHSVAGAALAGWAAVALAGATSGATAFLLGYGSHIGADLLTRGGCALLYPMARRRFRLWPAVRTGGAGEHALLVLILVALLLPACLSRWPVLRPAAGAIALRIMALP